MELEEGKLDETYAHTLKRDDCKGLITEMQVRNRLGVTQVESEELAV